jgi:hypothetical protein
MLKAQVGTTKQATAKLKRQLGQQERELKLLKKQTQQQTSQPQPAEDELESERR